MSALQSAAKNTKNTTEQTLNRKARRETDQPIRVMLIDDSLTTRTIFKRMLEDAQGIVVQGTASNAERGIALLRGTSHDEQSDVILLDLAMPGMGGLEALPELLDAAPRAQVLVVSSFTQDGAESTVKALSQGAADTMLKPLPGEFDDAYREDLLGRIRGLGSADIERQKALAKLNKKPARSAAPNQRFDWRKKRPEILAVGASTGGIRGLTLMLSDLSPEFDLPIVITQHLPASFIPVFARQLEKACGRKAQIANDGAPIRKGEITIATGEGHMNIARNADRLFVRLSKEPAVSGCLPSVDPMLASLAESCDGRALAIILSGMGSDGLVGAEILSAAGGTIWAQDAPSSAVWGMPGAVAKAGLTSYLAPPLDLSAAVMSEFAPTSRYSSGADPAKKGVA